MQDRSISQTELATRLGVGRAYVSLLFKPDRFFGEKAARSMESKLFMAPGYLDVDSSAPMAPVNWVSAKDIPDGALGSLPRVDVVLSADGEVMLQPSILPPIALERDWLEKRQVTARTNLVFCPVRGDSMESYLFDGDLVLIDIGRASVEDGLVYAIKYGDAIRVRRLSKRFDGGLIIRCDNPRYPEEVLSPQEAQHIRVLGRVIWRAG